MTALASDDPLHHVLDHVSHILPDQGPIGVFIHHNTLHAYQHLPFHEAVVAGAAALGARPYLEESAFREAWRTGRIENDDIDAVLTGSDRPIAFGWTERDVRRAMLADDLDVEDSTGLQFQVERAHGADPLWQALRARWTELGAPPRPSSHTVRPPLRRHRDVLVALGAPDTDLELHAELQRLAAAFLDQGQAVAPWPDLHHHTFLQAAASSYVSGLFGPRWAPGVRQDFRTIVRDQRPASDVIREVLAALGVDKAALPDFVEATLLALPGWAGMFSRLERHPEDLHHPLHVHLEDFLAVRLVLERRAVERVARAHGYPSDWKTLRARAPQPEPVDPIRTVYLLYGLARAAGVQPADVTSLHSEALDALFGVVDSFPSLARRRVFQEAYERRYRRQILDALAAHRPHRIRTDTRPLGQFVFCIDEREESIRRAVEEIDLRYETFGVAGFFGVAIDYRGLDDVHPAPYAPVVVIPAHEVHETTVYTDRSMLEQRQRRRGVWNRLRSALHYSSRTPVGGAAQSMVMGPLSGLSVGSQVLAPRQTQAFGRGLLERFIPRPLTRLQSQRISPETRSERGKFLGFTLQEKVDRVAATLTNIGLTRTFAPLVVVLGHGSTSLNNPHESAHDCGACGGRRGGANARLFAEMANRPEVRAALALRGIVVPRTTRGSWAGSTTRATTASSSTISKICRRITSKRSTTSAPRSTGRAGRTRSSGPAGSTTPRCR